MDLHLVLWRNENGEAQVAGAFFDEDNARDLETELSHHRHRVWVEDVTVHDA